LEVSIYLDASVIVALFTEDHFTDRATNTLASKNDTVIISDFAAVEFSAVIARNVRTQSITVEQARNVLSAFDDWSGRVCRRVETDGKIIAKAEAFLRRLDLTLRAPDAINIAIAQALDADLMTFDNKMAAAARALGTPLTETSLQ
jgi:predicted nucleic acid-binding protein